MILRQVLLECVWSVTTGDENWGFDLAKMMHAHGRLHLCFQQIRSKQQGG